MNARDPGHFNVFPKYNSAKNCRLFRGIGWAMVGGAVLGEIASIATGNMPGMVGSAVIGAGGAGIVINENSHLRHISMLTED